MQVHQYKILNYLTFCQDATAKQIDLINYAGLIILHISILTIMYDMLYITFLYYILM